MNSEFDQLAEKINRLAHLTSTMRAENGQLRRSNADLVAENKILRERMQEAHTRVEAVIAQLPQD